MAVRAILTGILLLLGHLTATINASPIDPAVAKADQLDPDNYWAVAYANPIEPTPRHKSGGIDNLTLAAADHISYCRDYSYENQGSFASPHIEDCLQIVRNIDKGGDWTVWEDKQHQLVQYQSCAFGVEPTYNMGYPDTYYLGNGDIITLIQESVKRYAIDGIVGSKGRMTCPQNIPSWDSYDEYVTWGLYWNPGWPRK